MSMGAREAAERLGLKRRSVVDSGGGGRAAARREVAVDQSALRRGVATIGVWRAAEREWTHWAPLPRFAGAEEGGEAG